MKFLRDKSLRQIGLYLLLLIAVLFIAEYFILRHKINTLDEVEQKLDFTRSTQLSSQQISLLVQRFRPQDTTTAVDIQARLVHQDAQLEVLGNGGRISRTDVILKPLARLPRISYDNLMRYWNQYKETVTTLLPVRKAVETTAATPAPAPVMTDDTTQTDSTQAAVVTPEPVAAVGTPAFVQPDPAVAAEARLRQESLAITLAHWYDNLFNDLEDEVARDKRAVENWVTIIILFNIALLAALYYCFDRFVLRTIRRLTETSARHEQVYNLPSNELGKLAGQINETLESLKDATDFVTAIGKGDLSMDYRDSLDNGYNRGKNKLADSLIDMQVKLKDLNEEERRRQWANEGLTKFVDILRSSSDNIRVLGDQIIASLVQYTRSNQGGLYILNDDDEHDVHLELVSLFAYDIKKHESRRIKPGEGLLGQTFLEKDTNYYTSFPDEYVRITSGLGDANPRAILIVPLKIDTKVYGIVELASFHEYQPHEIAFVERLGETIASTIASVQSAQKNKHLIEQFQQQTEEMRAQEEEMRQNMEELQATQEEIARKEQGYIARIQSLEEERKGLVSPAEALEQAARTFRAREADYEKTIESLKTTVAQKPVRSDDWQVAEEVEKTFRVNLEALRITQEELDRKG
ncbi:GAF domain-containing protein [Dawidia soli]|uniref:GAF domain-containing protein n=1 Tax=Dawidia soli TaxID=2782352 RepID=A0AAP2GL63_9BACT|nr:GAF domain-containing protein [Dawidia soli]MBT1690275.1 GAF domain-containing protein [Dawidia soli]